MNYSHVQRDIRKRGIYCQIFFIYVRPKTFGLLCTYATWVIQIISLHERTHTAYIFINDLTIEKEICHS